MPLERLSGLDRRVLVRRIRGLHRLVDDDLNRIVDAAIAVGDDQIQKAQTGSVNRESWTHGSSAQRKNWVSVGFKTGDWTKCDTFSATNLG